MPSEQEKRRFGELLRAARDSAGLTGTDLGHLATAAAPPGIKITQASISGWEKGKDAPREREKVDALAEVLAEHLDSPDALHRSLGYMTAIERTRAKNRLNRAGASARLDDLIERIERMEAAMSKVLDALNIQTPIGELSEFEAALIRKSQSARPHAGEQLAADNAAIEVEEEAEATRPSGVPEGLDE